MLMPKKVKYRKQQRGRMRGKAWRGSDVSFGDFGLKALEPCWLTDRQIEAARIAMTRSPGSRSPRTGSDEWPRRWGSAHAAWGCPACAASIPAGAVLRCAACGASAKLLSGDEIILEQIEMEVP